MTDADLVVTQPTREDTNSCKSGLIGVWHKNNLYPGTSTIENEKPPPNKYWFTNEKYKDEATKLVVLW
jgi:hypothetical protein